MCRWVKKGIVKLKSQREEGYKDKREREREGVEGVKSRGRNSEWGRQGERERDKGALKKKTRRKESSVELFYRIDQSNKMGEELRKNERKGKGREEDREVKRWIQKWRIKREREREREKEMKSRIIRQRKET